MFLQRKKTKRVPDKLWRRCLPFFDQTGNVRNTRLDLYLVGMTLCFLLLYLRLFSISIQQYAFYTAQAADQHQLVAQMDPKRGHVYAVGKDNSLYALAISQTTYHLYTNPEEVKDPTDALIHIEEVMMPKLEDRLTEEWMAKRTQLLSRLAKKNDPYEPLLDGLTEEQKNALQKFSVEGLHFAPQTTRLYPEKEYAAHIVGFVGKKEDGTVEGRYGLEGYFNGELTGTTGEVTTEKDAFGKWLAFATSGFDQARDGEDIILTIDRTVQYEACKALFESAKQLEVEKGAVIVMDPQTGAVLAMCSYPTFDPNKYSEVPDVSVYNNVAIFDAYEPGSIFKPITMSLGLESGVVTPETIYEDTGELKMGPFTIRNSDKKAHGWTSMTQVLESSLNLGTSFVARQLGNEAFVEGVRQFGFGQKTGMSLDFESAGNLGSLEKKKDIYSATASFGQGILVTPLQMVTAYSALVNGGKLMKPYIVSEIRMNDEVVSKQDPLMIKQVISPKTSALISGMLVSVVKNGQGNKAAIPGYTIGGKTGTAQVADAKGGYSADKTIHSFVGFGPVDHPKFVILTRLDHPKGVMFAEGSAVPLFTKVANAILQYYRIPKQ